MQKKLNWWKIRYDDKAGEQKPPENQQPPPTKTFTQEELNTILAKEKRSFQEERQKLMSELTTFKDKSTMTDQEKQELEARIEELQKATMTKEEIAKREQEKMKQAHENNLKALSDEANTWKNRYTKSTIERNILDAAIANDAFAPSQLVELIGNKSKLVPVLDEQGKPTGEFITKVSFEDVDKDQKPVTLEMTVPETVKRMKELPNRFGNLFKSGVVPGAGGSNNGAAYKPGTTISDPETYRKNRASLVK